MFSIREMDYETQEESERAFSRIPWVVEKVNNLSWQLISNRDISTNRPWIGEYDKDKMEFGLVEPRSFFRPQFLQFVVRGKITVSDGKTIINIKLRLGIHTLVMFSLVYLMAVYMIAEVISTGDIRPIGV